MQFHSSFISFFPLIDGSIKVVFLYISEIFLWIELLKELDVCEQESVDSLFDELSDFEIDVLVNNAGIGGSGSVEKAEIEFAKHLMETNYFGALRMMKKVIPCRILIYF